MISTAAELNRLGLNVKEVALDGGFTTAATNQTLADVAAERVFISGRQQPDRQPTSSSAGSS